MKETGIAVAIVVFAIAFAVTNGFNSSPVASSDVHVGTSAPTVDDDVDRGFLPGHVWVDQSGPAVYIAVSVADGAADWNQVD